MPGFTVNNPQPTEAFSKYSGIWMNAREQARASLPQQAGRVAQGTQTTWACLERPLPALSHAFVHSGWFGSRVQAVVPVCVMCWGPVFPGWSHERVCCVCLQLFSSSAKPRLGPWAVKRGVVVFFFFFPIASE